MRVKLPAKHTVLVFFYRWCRPVA